MINAITICGGTVRIKIKDLEDFAWGSGIAMCCESCINIVKARNSWMEVYA